MELLQRHVLWIKSYLPKSNPEDVNSEQYCYEFQRKSCLLDFTFGGLIGVGRFFSLSFLEPISNFLCSFMSLAGKGTHTPDIIAVDQSQHDGQHQSECISPKV